MFLSYLLIIEDLCFSYGAKQIIKNLSFTLSQGEKLLVTGPNGSGKTTLLKLILGNLKPQSGSIIKAPGLTVAYCKQDFPNLDFPISASEVVRMGLYRRRCKNEDQLVRQAMEKTNCLHLEKRLFSSLSGGERQRVSLARCFCQDAKVLLLDEPSSFLDTESGNTLIEIMSQLRNSELAVIAVTHDRTITDSLNWKELRMGGL